MKKVRFSEVSILSGTITAPSSKSFSHRLFFLALISPTSLFLTNILTAGVIDYTAEACKRLGLQILPDSENTIKCIPPDIIKSNRMEIDCGNSGTTVRFLTGLSLVISGEIILSGEFFKQNRPISPMLKAMQPLGTRYKLQEHRLIVETPILKSNLVKIPGNISSQFISGLLYGIIGLCFRPKAVLQKKFLEHEFIIETTTPLVSYPYLELTQKIFQECGFNFYIVQLPSGCLRIVVPMRNFSRFNKTSFIVPGDYSAISPILTASVLFGKPPLLIKNLPPNKIQADQEFLSILQKMGVEIEIIDTQVQLLSNLTTQSHTLDRLLIDCANHPDLFPVLCVLGAYTKTTTFLTNIDHIRFKESNRVDFMVDLLSQFGVQIEMIENSVHILGNSAIHLYANHNIIGVFDHRVLMALCVFALGLSYNGYHLTIENVNRIADSYPFFFDDLRNLGGKFTLEGI